MGNKITGWDYTIIVVIIPIIVVIYGYMMGYMIILVGGIPTPLKNMKVSWDDEIPNIWKNKKMFQATNQVQLDDVWDFS